MLERDPLIQLIMLAVEFFDNVNPQVLTYVQIICATTQATFKYPYSSLIMATLMDTHMHKLFALQFRQLSVINAVLLSWQPSCTHTYINYMYHSSGNSQA